MPVKQDNVKNWFWILLNIALAAAVLLGLMTTKYLWKQSRSISPARMINISAEGKVVVSPDVATLSFSVVSEGADPVKLPEDNNKKINAAIEFVKGQGVEAKDIKTADYNLSPRYEYNEKTRKTFIDGYTLTQTVFIKIRDFSKTGTILAALPGLGINQISSLNFAIDDPDKFLNEARQEAFEKARAKAEAMAMYNGVKIRKVINFSEYGGGYPIYARAEAFGKGGDLGAPIPAPTIEPGSQEVTVNVNVTYEIW